MFHFLKVIAAFAAFAIAQCQAAVGSHAYKLSLKLALPVTVAVQALAPYQPGSILPGYLLLLAAHQAVIPMAKALRHAHQQFMAVQLLVRNLAKRNGIRRIAMKLALVDIDANAKDAPLHLGTAQRSLYHRTAEFLLAKVYIVGPLYIYLRFEI